MEVHGEIQRLKCLLKDSQANMSEIVSIYYRIAKDDSCVASSVVSFLKESAVYLLSPKVITIMKKHRLEAFNYVLVANNLLELDDVKDDLENGEVLMTNAPANAFRKLKKELGVACAVLPATPVPLVNPQAPMMGSAISMDQAASPGDEKRLSLEIKNQCINMKNVNGMILYKLPLKPTPAFSGAPSIVRRVSFGEPQFSGNKICKTILVMGATGSGKTTMINAMMNFILGVRWEDPFRFQLIEEIETSQALSQTGEVTAYDIHYRDGFRIPYSLTIVDTPGFGDTEGIERDQEITSAVKQFFDDKNGIQELDAVGFTVQSALTRLTAAQKYIFNSVLSIFGKDIEENVRFLATFADGRKPPVLEAIKMAKLPCRMDSNGEPCYHSFNNGAVYVSNKTPGDRLSPIEWDNAMQNFQSFFTELSRMPVKSLNLTKEVLNNREFLRNTIDCLETTTQAHLMKMEELRKTEEMITLHKDHVDSNKNFELKVMVAKKKKVATDMNLTAMNCQICQVHVPISLQSDVVE